MAAPIITWGTWERVSPSPGPTNQSFPLSELSLLDNVTYTWLFKGISNNGFGSYSAPNSPTLATGTMPTGLTFSGITNNPVGPTYEMTLSGMPSITGGTVNSTWTITNANAASATMSSDPFLGLSFSVTGDPHFMSFRGEKFDFHGEPNKIYNLYSDKDIQINSLFFYWETSGADHWTAMAEIGIKFGNLKIKVDSVSQTVTINDVVVTNVGFDYGFVTTVDQLPEKYEKVKDHEGFGTFIKGVMIRIFNYEIFVTFSTDHVNPVYLNLMMDIKSDALDAHGVVGQTAMYKGEPRVSTGKDGAGIVEGACKDYEVSDLFADDFKFNKWTPIEEKLSA